MNVTFLGQAGLLFEIDGFKIMVDPYFSDNVKLFEPKNYRRQPVDEKYLKIKPNVLIITHNHLDHYDLPTVEKYLTAGNVVVLSPYSVWKNVRELGGNNEYVLFNDGTSVTINCVKFSAVYAAHSDEYAIGVMISDNNENYYITGDTLYSEKVFKSLPNEKIKAVFLPINGKGNNMNAVDAIRFAERLNADNAVPLHFGMFDGMTGKEFDFNKAVIPQIYKEIRFK